MSSSASSYYYLCYGVSCSSLLFPLRLRRLRVLCVCVFRDVRFLLRCLLCVLFRLLCMMGRRPLLLVLRVRRVCLLLVLIMCLRRLLLFSSVVVCVFVFCVCFFILCFLMVCSSSCSSYVFSAVCSYVCSSSFVYSSDFPYVFMMLRRLIVVRFLRALMRLSSCVSSSVSYYVSSSCLSSCSSSAFVCCCDVSMLSFCFLLFV